MNNLVHAVCEEEKVELLEKLDGVRSERDDARRQLATAREYSATLRGQLERAEIRLQQNEQRIAALEAKLYEARNAVRLATSVILFHAPHISPVYLTDMIARWDKE